MRRYFRFVLVLSYFAVVYPFVEEKARIMRRISFASSLNHLLTNEYTCRYTIRPARLDTWPPQTTPQVALYANHSGTTT